MVRVSGSGAGVALEALTGPLPTPRRAVTRNIRSRAGEMLDRALVLWMPAPHTATGEDIAEFHLHGGRAVIAAVESSLGSLPGLRRAEAGEFTRRAFANGKIDLAEAEGLGDLLTAETELQRQAAMASAGGGLSRIVEDWRDRVLMLSARVESALDFSDEDDVGALDERFVAELAGLNEELAEWLSHPRAEKLREGYRVVLAGPPNAGKSTLFNALVEDEAAITSPRSGTTRDVLERSVSLAGIPFTVIDTAGIHEGIGDDIETIGIERARSALERADLVLWLGAPGDGPDGAWNIAAKSDEARAVSPPHTAFSLSALTGAGLAELRSALVDRARESLPKPGSAALNARQHGLIAEARNGLEAARGESDALLIGEHLRVARMAFDRLIGRSSTEDMLDSLFGRFCIGK